jgi:hypothetical protein
MKQKKLTGLENSGTETQLQQVLSHLQISTPAHGSPTCQACGDAITEGQSVTVYLARPTGHPNYTIEQCRCREHNDDLTGLFTLGVHELIVDGRIGQCRDHATQQTWPVLLAPSVRHLSAADTTTARVCPAPDTTDTNTWTYAEQLHERVADAQPRTHAESERPERTIGGQQ